MKKGQKKHGPTEEEPGGCSHETANNRSQTCPRETWQAAYQKSVQNPAELSRYLSLGGDELSLLKKVGQLYQMRIPFYYLLLVKDPADSADPIRRQCVPSPEELKENSFEREDPLGEKENSPYSCLVHRYPDRVLLLVTNRCFMYCRHCTRKRIWHKQVKEPTLNDISNVLDYLAQHREVREVIISGGDPLTLPTEKLEYILSSVSSLANIRVIRIGTRAPVVLPQRIDDRLCNILRKYDNLWINVQFNHPREIGPEATGACRRIQACGIPVSNQSVLLKGINDDYRTMTELCQKLQEIRVRPYYLFQCDPVAGTSHFQTPVDKGIEIVGKMRGFTSGMCVPTFVVDGIDGNGKVSLQPDYLVSRKKGYLILKNYQGRLFKYHNPK